ncbi:hypothetical protein SprV_0401616500 [Sparganum proliferum]
MGSPTSSLVAELVLQQPEKVAFSHYKPAFWRRYADDTFVIVEKDKLSGFQDLLNSIFPDIQSTKEGEEADKLPFLDVLATRTPDACPRVDCSSPRLLDLDENFLDLLVNLEASEAAPPRPPRWVLAPVRANAPLLSIVAATTILSSGSSSGGSGGPSRSPPTPSPAEAGVT